MLFGLLLICCCGDGTLIFDREKLTIDNMAESAAHLTTNLMARPSLFEVLASDTLINTFYPALKRISNVRTDFLIGTIERVTEP